MRIVGLILRLIGYVFNGGLSLGLTAVGLVTLVTGSGNFQIEQIPWWTGATLAKVLVGFGLLGILATALAVRGKFPVLQVLWTAAVVFVFVNGFYISNFKFDDYDHFRSSLNMTSGAFTSFLGSLTALSKKTS